jgi:hypothetical protein
MEADHDKPEWLLEWQEPQRLLEIANEARQLTDAEFLVSRNAKVFREAWVIGKVGSIAGVHRARMSDQERPDGFFKLRNGREIPVEVTELLQEGRRRGDESFSGIRHQLHKELTDAVDYNGAWIEAAVTKKLNKDASYPSGTMLLIYHNTSLYDWDSARQQINNEFERAASRKGVNIIGSIISYNGRLYGEAAIRSLQA